MREKWKALTKRERLLFAAALVFLALAVLLRFVPGLRFSALLCLCAAAVLFIFYLLEHFARRGYRAAAWCELALIAVLLLGFSLFTVLETMVVRGSFADESEARLQLEERSASTEENLRFSREMLEEMGVDPTQRVAIVTSDYHLCRARLMWGGASTAVPAHMPSALYFRCLSVNYYIREAFGLAAYFVYGG